MFDESRRPITATKPSKIITAFRNVPEHPVEAEPFAETHGISVAVLRQIKRFDKTGLPGKVKVRKDHRGVLMIWRDDTP